MDHQVGHRIDAADAVNVVTLGNEVTGFKIDVRVTLCKTIEIIPVGGCGFPGQQSCFRQQAAGRAYAADAGTGRGDFPQPRQPGPCRIDGRQGITPYGGQQQQVGRGQLIQAQVRSQFETTDQLYRLENRIRVSRKRICGSPRRLALAIWLAAWKTSMGMVMLEARALG